MVNFMHYFIRSVLLVCTLISVPAQAENRSVYELTVAKPMTQVYPALSKSFENSRFFVVKELNIGESLAAFSEKWGDNYNRNGLTAIRSMVFCNGWYANQVSNLDPSMLGLCPLHMTLYEKNGHSTALFNRPTAISGGSPANDMLAEIEQEVIEIIKQGMQ